MAAKYFIRNITAGLSRATVSSQNAFKRFPLITNFLLTNRQVFTACPVGIEDKHNRLVVHWKESLTDEYPLVWLRDNCQCSACFNQSSQSRTINFSQFQLNQTLRHLVNLQIFTAMKLIVFRY